MLVFSRPTTAVDHSKTSPIRLRRPDMVAAFDFPVSGLSCYLRHKPDHLVHCFCGPAFLITLWDSLHTGPGTLHQGINHESNWIAMHLQ